MIRSYTLSWSKESGWIAPKPLPAKQQLILLFVDSRCFDDSDRESPSYDQVSKAVGELTRHYPLALVVGCSASPRIIGAEFADAPVIGMLLTFEHTEVQTFTLAVTAGEERHAADQIGQALDRDGLQHILLFSDGLHLSTSRLVAQLNTQFSGTSNISGGMAGDGDQFRQTFVISDQTIQQKALVAVGFYGSQLQVATGAGNGWNSFGPKRLVSRSEGRRVYSFDDQSALSLYKKYLGPFADNLPQSALYFPIAVSVSSNSEIIRTVFDVDESTGSLLFSDDVPQGRVARFMKANSDRLIDAAEETANQVRSHLRAKDGQFALVVSCIGRYLVMGERSIEELEAVQAALPDTPMMGFYSYGEMSGVHPGDQQCELHNQTMTLILMAEQDNA